MIRLILHTLWARRRRNGWLLAELILVSVISWAIFDPVIVSLHDRSLPLGYDADRMAIISFGEFPPEAPGYDAARLGILPGGCVRWSLSCCVCANIRMWRWPLR